MGDEKLSEKVKAAIEDVNNLEIVSIASIWELAIKVSLYKIKFSNGFNHFLSTLEDNGFELLPITIEHTLVLSTLEFIHRDPFDRILIAQCIADKLTLATKDDNIKRYTISTIW